MTDALRTVEDIFVAIGGTTATALALGIKQSTASEMRRRGSIPVKYWKTLVEAAGNRGLALDYQALVDAHGVEAAE